MTSPDTTTASEFAAPARQQLAELLALEEAVTSRLETLRAIVAAHPGAAAAYARFHDLATTQRDDVRDLLHNVGGGAPSSLVGSLGAPGRSSPGSPSEALREAYTLFNQAAIGYAVLDHMAHILVTGPTKGPLLQLAARHLRGYAAAAQEINQLIADVVAWELRQQGQQCVCACRYCSLGVCWCIASSTDRINAAWRETTPTTPQGVLVAPNTRTPPGLDIREGDIVLAINGRPVTSAKEVTAAVNEVMAATPSPPSGVRVPLSIRRPGQDAVEVIASPT